ncbi:phosphatidylinositol 4-phosphate 3-kinase C2 domain-containing subunit alpha-like [Trematomus bernacchii]|uniref:phosphatidylinositol 4-phosphate 3-kinase C2 domain-containing subunit alpha-like n=1 Tax=Trematomus bernacchii TaxID=40690 RepID=UPI00146A7003|nr:phosphatidylinositol 4-phosphate 3-kinase C2 domain-containing subunit alpha-like [Trematomus bernacchii]
MQMLECGQFQRALKQEGTEITQYKTVERVVQTLKNLCCALDETKTQAITEAVKRLKHSVNLPQTRSPKMGSTSSGQSSNGKWARDDSFLDTIIAMARRAMVRLCACLAPWRFV